MLTGQIALEDSESKDPLKKMLKRSFGVIKPISEHRYAPEESLAAIVERMMKIDLKARYQSMRQVVEELEEYEGKINPAVAEARAFARKYTGPQEEEEPAVDELLTEQRAEVFDPQALEVKTLGSRNVLCVEAQTEIQDALRKNLSRMGYRVLLVTDAERAAEHYRESPPDAVIFDADGLGSDTISALVDMQEKAEEDGRTLLALVLLGPRQTALKEQLPTAGKLVVLVKPIKLKQVQDAISELLPLT